nr:RpiB/LacA/LacB family sugar-phosphate isomerase [Pedobacter sp. ASV19]
MKIGIAADHGGFELKEKLIAYLKPMGYEIEDFGAYKLDTSDDYPDFIVPLAQAVAAGKLSRGIAVCGSGVGASVAANKIAGARAALITEHFSAHQGVEDDDLNIICLGGRITGYVAAEELVLAFLRAEFSGADRHQRRLEKVRVLEKENLN